MNALMLWDIDGNLVNIYHCHTPSYQEAIQEVYGVKPAYQDIEVNYGMPAREVIAIPVRKLNLKESIIQEKMEKVLTIYSKKLKNKIKNDSGNVLLPGVLDLLKKISSLKIPMAIVTGNIKKAGESIVNASGLNKFFISEISAYADDFHKRYEIVGDAIDKAKKKGFVKKDTKIYVFGDTPADIEAAKINNCISVAVIKNSNKSDSSPGGISYRQRKKLLIEAKPDFLFDDYTHASKILSEIGVY